MKKIKDADRLWTTNTPCLSGSMQMLYGVELPRALKDRFEHESLNESSIQH